MKKRRYPCEQCGERHTEKFMDWQRPELCWRCAEERRDVETELHFCEFIPDEYLDQDQLWRKEVQPKSEKRSKCSPAGRKNVLR